MYCVLFCYYVFVFKQKTAYEMRISDWSSDVCSSDLVPSDPEFSIPALALVDSGWRYAIAHVRGGSEKGRQWFLGGRKFTKRNSFTDFIACAEYLAREGYTAKGKIVAYRDRKSTRLNSSH